MTDPHTTPKPDKRLIEDYIPIKKISAEASREKSIRHGHISTLHLWWARRPLVAARAAVFGALVQADAQPQLIDPETHAPMTITKFMIELCKWQLGDEILEEARRLIREVYPDGPPKVLDMFAGGGSIPLEALRLGAEAYALDLNPVAHIIELATLVYPQKYGAQLAVDVRKWGEWVLERVRAEVGDLYPLIADPDYTGVRERFLSALPQQTQMFPGTQPEQLTLDDTDDDPDLDMADDAAEPDAIPVGIPAGYLQPVAYLWTRTVICPNPACRATVPLVRQTWLKKKKGDNVALAMKPYPTENRMAFYVRRAADPADFGFDPAGLSQRGNSVCGRCGTTVTSDYVKIEGKAGRMAAQMMATVCVRAGVSGKVYLSPDEHDLPVPDEDAIRARIEALTGETGITPPDEPLPEKLTGGMCTIYGLTRFRDLFTPRQMLTMLTFVKWVRLAHDEMTAQGCEEEYAKAVATYLGLTVSSFTNGYTNLCRWIPQNQQMGATYARQALPMVWDTAEIAPLGGSSGNIVSFFTRTISAIKSIDSIHNAGVSNRASATKMPYADESMDSVVSDPPYYDNISYADLSDFFYVWLKRLIGNLYSEHFANEITPKRNEAIAASYRHKNKEDSSHFYESMMATAFQEASRVLRPLGAIVVVYAHKTTAGWSTLADSLRNAGFTITEAWPLDTEKPGRAIAYETAALASSIFLVGRKRGDSPLGYYATDVLTEMQRIVRERVGFFLAMGITGADLNIATVGAGLAPYTRYARVELPNGEELTAAAYLEEVQAEVVRVLLGEASKVDAATRYYIMARQYYASAQVEFDEANTLARATGIELDSGASALTKGRSALVEKKGAKVRLRDYSERGTDDTLGLPTLEHPKPSLVDVLHRLLWLAENDNSVISEFLLTANPDKYLLRVAAQSLGGRGLASEPTPGAVRDERSAEQRAIDTLLASWRRLFEEGTLI